MKIIKIFFLILLASSCVSLNKKSGSYDSQNYTRPTQYVFGSYDIPLLDGLILVRDNKNSFDTVFGNMVISRYYSEIPLREVKFFYIENLPKMGWKKVGSSSNILSFRRYQEKLEIRFDYASKGLYVRFALS